MTARAEVRGRAHRPWSCEICRAVTADFAAFAQEGAKVAQESRHLACLRFP